MNIRINRWKRTVINASLSFAIISASIGCTNTSNNRLPSRNTRIPPPKLTTGEASSPALNQIKNSGGSSNLGTSTNPASSNNSVNNSGMMPATKIGSTDLNRPNPQSGYNSTVGIPTSTFQNPASFGGPKTTWNSTTFQVTPVSNLSTSQSPPKNHLNTNSSPSSLPTINPSSTTPTSSEMNSLSPMKSSTNEFQRTSEAMTTKKPELEPLPPIPSESTFYPTSSNNSSSNSKISSPVLAPSISNPSTLKLPDMETKDKSKPELDPVKPVSLNSTPTTFDPIPYSVSPPVLDTPKSNSTPTTKTNVPLPVISSEIPPAPVVPQDGSSLKIR